jgi:hypothetical protein
MLEERQIVLLRRLLEARMGNRGKRERVLGAISFNAIKQLVIAKVEHRPAKLDLGDYPYLPAANVRTTSAADYMALVSGSAT